MKNIEKRMGQKTNFERRKLEDGREVAVARGYAAVFNKPSEDLGGFTEVIAPGAFDAVMEDDVRALFNHDPNHLLGRTASGTLNISIDEAGLAYELELPDTQTGRDLAISLERGDVNQSSFAFSVEDDEFEREEGKVVRTINKVSRLYDVSPVTYPAYPDTTIGLRNLQSFLANADAKTDEDDSAQLRAKMMMQVEIQKLRGAMRNPSENGESSRSDYTHPKGEHVGA